MDHRKARPEAQEQIRNFTRSGPSANGDAHRICVRSARRSDLFYLRPQSSSAHGQSPGQAGLRPARARSRRPDAISPHLDSPRLETHSVRSDAAPDECRGCAPTTPQPRPPPQANCYRVAFGSTRACPLPYRGCRPVISVHRELRPRWPTRLRQMEKTVPLRQWIGPQEI